MFAKDIEIPVPPALQFLRSPQTPVKKRLTSNKGQVGKFTDLKVRYEVAK